MRPLYFGGEERPLFGFLHEGSAQEAAVGLVVCNPFGYEAICAHRSLRHFASLGVPSLRFDYDGTGDSAGSDLDPDRLGAWTRSVGLAIDALKRETGVGRVVLLGVRFGVLVAALACAGRTDVDSLVAIAPVVSGKAYLRELKLLQMALGLGEPPTGTKVDETGQEALGFVITAETKAAIAKVDVTKLEVPRVLLLDRADMPAGDAWAARLGDRVTAKRLPGFVEMVLDPHKAEVPAEMLREVAAWLSAPAVPKRATLADPTGSAKSTLDGVTETALLIGGRLFGILSEPETKPRKALLLLNAGSVHHIGPNRVHVAYARRWAKLGYAVLRMDMAGIGDSPPLPGEPENVVYADKAIDDVALAVDFLRDKAAAVVGMGVCSGAYHAFKSAEAGAIFESIVMINPLTFDYRPGMSLDYPEHKVAQDAERYGTAVMQADKWKKLLRGEVHLQIALRTMSRHALGLAKARARDAARRIGRPLPGDLGAELDAIAKRGVGIRFVFAEGDPGYPLLRGQAGSALPKLRACGAIRIDTIPGPDHTFTPVWSHDVLRETLGFR